MQKKYADTEKFTVVIAYVQELEDEAVEYLKKTAPDIPVYDQLNPPDSPCGRGIPDAYLFDHTGTLVEHDHPMALDNRVAGLVEAAPDPDPPAILGKLEPVLLVEEAKALRDPGRPAKEVLVALEELAAGPGERAKEAQALLDQVRAWLPAEVDWMERLAKRRPGMSAYHGDLFLRRFEGVDAQLDARVQELTKELTSAAEVPTFVRAMKDLEKALLDPGTRKATQFEQRAKKALSKIEKSSKASKALKKEAAELQAELEGG